MTESQSSTSQSSALNPCHESNKTSETDITIEEFRDFLVKEFDFTSSLSKQVANKTSSEERKATWSALEEFLGLPDVDPTINDKEKETSIEEEPMFIKEEAEDDDPFSSFELDPYISHLESNNPPETIVSQPTLLALQISFESGADDVNTLMNLYLADDEDVDDCLLKGPSPPKRSRHG